MARKYKADCRADVRGGGWIGIPKCVAESAAFRDLSLFARAVLIEILVKFNGYNNGSIAISQREISMRLGNTNFRKIGRAFAELMEHGLIDVSAEGRWKERLAREYRVTFINTVEGCFRVPATNDYLRWTPGRKSGAGDASARDRQSADVSSAMAGRAVDGVSAGFLAKRRISANAGANARQPPADDASALICKPYPVGVSRAVRTRKMVR